MPAYYTLGFHLSRWGYNSTDGVRAARERMKAAGIPQDVQTCDIDYMDRYTVKYLHFSKSLRRVLDKRMANPC